MTTLFGRRQAIAGLALAACGPPRIRRGDTRAPQVPFGVQVGEVSSGGAVVWSKTNQTAQLVVEWAEGDTLGSNVRSIRGPIATLENDYTARVRLEALPLGARVTYRVRFDSVAGPGPSDEIMGSFRTPGENADITFAWSGDTCGQGYGIDKSAGGMRTYSSILRHDPDFFVHAGDLVYADSPIAAPYLVTPAKSKVAETLEGMRGNFQYNLLDDNVRALFARVPQLVMWDDHETHDNWFPGQLLDDERYTEKRASVIAAHARRAMFEYTPTLAGHMYRAIKYGPLLELFMLDCRSYRSKNAANLEESPSEETHYLGEDQIAWLTRALEASSSTWKVIVCDMPLGLVIPDPRKDEPNGQEGWSNGDDDVPRGRELELARILGFIKDRAIQNVVWLTADVHYCASHHFLPERAKMKNFLPFWEFVSGPLHAGTYGPNKLDMTFGPEVVFQKTAPEGEKNVPPSRGLQFFGVVRIEHATKKMTVAHYDMSDTKLWEIVLDAV